MRKLNPPKLRILCWICDGQLPPNYTVLHKNVRPEDGWKYALGHIAVCGQKCADAAWFRGFRNCPPGCFGAGFMAVSNNAVMATLSYEEWESFREYEEQVRQRTCSGN